MNGLNRRVTVAAVPVGWPTEADFRLEEVLLRPLAPGEVRVKVRYLSMDPWTRGQLQTVGEVVVSEGVGLVSESLHPDFRPGDAVWGMTCWQEYATLPGERLKKVETGRHPLSTVLGPLGLTGLTAYFALLSANPQPGETVVVTAAAGAVGSIAAQVAKIMGCRVIGTTGSDAKVALLQSELGLDHAFNYKQVADYEAHLRTVAPKGIDVLLDGVGGPLQDAVAANTKPGARAVLYGSISRYNLVERPPAPQGLALAGARVSSFSAGDYFARWPESRQILGQWLDEGKLTYRETITDGLQNAPAAFLGMMRGENTGKALVRLF